MGRRLKTMEELRACKVGPAKIVNERFVGDERLATPEEVAHVRDSFARALLQGNVTVNGKPVTPDGRIG